MEDTKHVPVGPRRKNPPFSVVSIVVVLIIAAATALIYFAPGLVSNPFSHPRERVEFGFAHEPLAALAMIARRQGYFADAGLDVTYKDYESGKQALTALQKGDVPIAVTADIPIVFASFDNPDFSIVSTIGSSDNEPRIVARSDRGIHNPSDLRGKRIGTQKASAVHFFLYLFLLENGMTTDDVDIRFMKAGQLAKALAAGDVDAISMREPFTTQAATMLGDKAVLFTRPGLYRKTINVVAAKSLIKEKPEVVQAAIRALARAEAYAVEHPQEAMKIVAATLGVKPEEVAATWPDSSLKVSLDQSLILSLEDEAKWIIASKLEDRTQVPNYLDVVNVDALKAVDSVLVSLVQ